MKGSPPLTVPVAMTLVGRFALAHMRGLCEEAGVSPGDRETLEGEVSDALWLLCDELDIEEADIRQCEALILEQAPLVAENTIPAIGQINKLLSDRDW